MTIIKITEEIKLAIAEHTCHFDGPNDQGRSPDTIYDSEQLFCFNTVFSECQEGEGPTHMQRCKTCRCCEGNLLIGEKNGLEKKEPKYWSNEKISLYLAALQLIIALLALMIG